MPRCSLMKIGQRGHLARLGICIPRIDIGHTNAQLHRLDRGGFVHAVRLVREADMRLAAGRSLTSLGR